MADYLIRGTAANDFVRAFAVTSAAVTETARKAHDLSPVASAALGRTLAAALMMGADMKNENDVLTIQFLGDGPIGGITATANSRGEVKGFVNNPSVILPPNEFGKLDVGGAVGHAGRMSVIKDLGMKKQYIGQSELVSGEIAMDFANYFTVSEQQPSLVALGVLVSGNAVLKAGGLLIQPLPGCPDEIIDQLELRSPMFADISREMTFAPIEQLCNDWFRGMEPRILERTPLRYRCTCSRERMEKALISLGQKDLQSLIDEDEGAELVCHFCRSKYSFSTQELRDMLHGSK